MGGDDIKSPEVYMKNSIFEKLVDSTVVGLKATILTGKVKAFHDAKVSSQEAIRDQWREDHPVLTALGIVVVELSVDFIIGSMLMAEIPEILKLITKEDEGKEVDMIEDKGVE